MTVPLSVETSALAARHIRQLEAWWRLNRTSAPNAVREELERALRLITAQPRIGPTALDVDLEGVRRVHLARIGHYLYYRIVGDSDAIELLELWSDSREEGPPI